jgi:hypothetical protein
LERFGARGVEIGQRPAKGRHDALRLAPGMAMDEGLPVSAGVDLQGVVVVVMRGAAGCVTGSVLLDVLKPGEN